MPQPEGITRQAQLFSLAMMQAWGYPEDEQTQALITAGLALEASREIRNLREAKNWVRSQRPKPAAAPGLPNLETLK